MEQSSGSARDEYSCCESSLHQTLTDLARTASRTSIVAAAAASTTASVTSPATAGAPSPPHCTVSLASGAGGVCDASLALLSPSTHTMHAFQVGNRTSAGKSAVNSTFHGVAPSALDVLPPCCPIIRTQEWTALVQQAHDASLERYAPVANSSNSNSNAGSKDGTNYLRVPSARGRGFTVTAGESNSDAPVPSVDTGVPTPRSGSAATTPMCATPLSVHEGGPLTQLAGTGPCVLYTDIPFISRMFKVFGHVAVTNSDRTRIYELRAWYAHMLFANRYQLKLASKTAIKTTSYTLIFICIALYFRPCLASNNSVWVMEGDTPYAKRARARKQRARVVADATTTSPPSTTTPTA